VFFQYADEGLVAEFDGTGTEIKTYGYKPGSTWTTDPLFMKQGTEYYFYHNDHLGTPQKMTAVNGAVVWGAQYEAFGKASVDGSSTVTNNLRFPGQYFDDETGLCYNYFRYYDSETGRYTKKDPIGFRGGTNLFVYVFNNSLNKIDPLGLMAAVFGIPCENHPLAAVMLASAEDWCAQRGKVYKPGTCYAYQGSLGWFWTWDCFDCSELSGHDFEDYLARKYGGTGEFQKDGRNFDGQAGDKWWSAKSGNYWEDYAKPGKGFEKFKSDHGAYKAIADKYGKEFEVHSNSPIPDHVKNWLTKKGIPYFEH
jgi:RHS repeat-associated protein